MGCNLQRIKVIIFSGHCDLIIRTLAKSGSSIESLFRLHLILVRIIYTFLTIASSLLTPLENKI